jgi:hypothetical protein
MLLGICCDDVELVIGFSILSADVNFFIAPCLGNEGNKLELGGVFSPKMFSADAMK